MKVKDAPIGSRVLFQPKPGDFSIGYYYDYGPLVGTVIHKHVDNKSSSVYIGFRLGEKHSMTCAPTTNEKKVDPLIVYVHFFNPEMECQPACNRRFLCN